MHWQPSQYTCAMKHSQYSFKHLLFLQLQRRHGDPPRAAALGLPAALPAALTVGLAAGLAAGLASGRDAAAAAGVATSTSD